MSYSWSQMITKAQRVARDSNADVLVQLKADMNEGLDMFLTKFGRYFTRKQQFTNLIANQQIYQTPVDCEKILGMTTEVTSNFQPPVKEIRDEFQWRNITAVTTATNYPCFYYPLGNDKFSLWPIPSQDVTNGLRLYYQPTTSQLTFEDITSTTLAATVTVTNGSPTVTASSGVFTTDMTGLSFQVTDVLDQSFYEIVASTSTTLTLKSAYTATSGASHAFRICQLSILPKQYQSMPVDYALWVYFEAAGNTPRATWHKGQYDLAVKEAVAEYSTSVVGNIITDDDMDGAYNTWFIPPPAA